MPHTTPQTAKTSGAHGCLLVLALTVIVFGLVYLGYASGLLHLEYTRHPKPVPRRIAGAPAIQATAPSPLQHCPRLLQDVIFLSKVWERVSLSQYRPTKDKCARWMKKVNDRISATWGKGVFFPVYRRGESTLATAARNVGVGGVEVVLAYACEGSEELVRKHGPSVLAAYNKQFIQAIQQLQRVCQGM